MITFILHTHFHFDKPKIILISTLSKNVQFSKSPKKLSKYLISQYLSKQNKKICQL